MRVKIEVNTREHFNVHGITSKTIAVESPWFTGEAQVATYSLPELLGTKLRALYQRKKGRDLFDLALALDHPEFDAARLVEAFDRYMRQSKAEVSRANFEANMAAKLVDRAFLDDVAALLRTGLEFNPITSWARVHAAIVTRLPGDPWKGSSKDR